jgi:hypothetical protein
MLSLGFINGWLLNKRGEKQSCSKLGTVNVPWRCIWPTLSEGMKNWQTGAVFVRKDGILGKFTKWARVCNCFCRPLGAQIARKIYKPDFVIVNFCTVRIGLSTYFLLLLFAWQPCKQSFTHSYETAAMVS